MAKVSAAAMAASLDALSEVAKTYGVTIDKAGGIHLALLEKTATERSDPETREAATKLIDKLVRENPFAEFNAKDVAPKVGLMPKQADIAFCRHQIKVKQLVYKQAAE